MKSPHLDDFAVLVLLDMFEEHLLQLLPGHPARAGERVVVEHQVGVGLLALPVHPVGEGVDLRFSVILVGICIVINTVPIGYQVTAQEANLSARLPYQSPMAQ